MDAEQLRDEINGWISLGLSLASAIPAIGLAIQGLLHLLPQEIQQEWTPEKVQAKIDEQAAIRAADDAARNERRTEELPITTTEEED